MTYIVRKIILLKKTVSLVVVLSIAYLFVSCGDNYQKEAVSFIKKNMKNKYSVSKYIINKNGEKISFDPYSYNTLYQAKDTLDSLTNTNILFAVLRPDTEYVSGTYINEHVNLMLGARKSSPYLKQLDFEHFCEFVLPYRIGKSSLSFTIRHYCNGCGLFLETFPEIFRLKKLLLLLTRS